MPMRGMFVGPARIRAGARINPSALRRPMRSGRRYRQLQPSRDPRTPIYWPADERRRRRGRRRRRRNDPLERTRRGTAPDHSNPLKIHDCPKQRKSLFSFLFFFLGSFSFRSHRVGLIPCFCRPITMDGFLNYRRGEGIYRVPTSQASTT